MGVGPKEGIKMNIILTSTPEQLKQQLPDKSPNCTICGRFMMRVLDKHFYFRWACTQEYYVWTEDYWEHK